MIQKIWILKHLRLYRLKSKDLQRGSTKTLFQSEGRIFFFFFAFRDNKIRKNDRRKYLKKGLSISPNPLIFLVAGRGFEPLTFGL